MVPMTTEPDDCTQDWLIERIKGATGTYHWALIWGAVYSHRQASVRLFRDTVFEMLDDPTMTRSKMRREVAMVAKQIEEHGP